MKKGDFVKCTDVFTDPFFGSHYTKGKIYKVVAGKGDLDNLGIEILSDAGMVIEADSGKLLFAVHPQGVYANWEVVK